MNSDTPSTWGEKNGKQELLRVGYPACLKTLCFPTDVDFQYWLDGMELGAGDMEMAGGEPADVDRLGLHQWVLPQEGKVLGRGPVEALCDKCPGLSSVGALAPGRRQSGCMW